MNMHLWRPSNGIRHSQFDNYTGVFCISEETLGATPTLECDRINSWGFLNRQKTGVVYIRIDKACDKILHDVLMYKLIMHNIPQQLIVILWSVLKVEQFLSDKQFYLFFLQYWGKCPQGRII